MWHKIVLTLLILINILNLIFDRDGDGGNRVVIQAANCFTLFVLIFYVMRFKSSSHTFFLKALIMFIFLFFIYFFAQYIYILNPYFNAGPYVRWLLGLFLILFFSKYEKNNLSTKLLQLYILTYIIQIVKKIFSGHWYIQAMSGYSELAGGDYASIGLAMIVPLLFIVFDKRKASILFFACFAATLFSLRRSSILAIAIAIPFFWPYLKSCFSKKFLVIFISIASFFSIYVWTKIGNAVLIRMTSLIQGDSAGSASTAYGSGRSLYWGSLMNDFINSGNYFQGNGMGSVYEHFCTHFVYVHLSHAHSDLFEILFTFGILGIAVWLTFAIFFFFAIKKSSDLDTRQIGYGAFAIYGFVAISSGVLLRAEFFPMGIAMGILAYHVKSRQPLK